MGSSTGWWYNNTVTDAGLPSGCHLNVDSLAVSLNLDPNGAGQPGYQPLCAGEPPRYMHAVVGIYRYRYRYVYRQI
jgi:hypothetical protein